jgi:hypothetical protein
MMIKKLLKFNVKSYPFEFVLNSSINRLAVEEFLKKIKIFFSIYYKNLCLIIFTTKKKLGVSKKLA